MGLRPEAMFGCAMNFLLEVQPEVKDMFRRELEVTQSSPGLACLFGCPR